jgi:hypothetical protein
MPHTAPPEVTACTGVPAEAPEGPSLTDSIRGRSSE